MHEHGNTNVDRTELAASLVPLGIREITERMEVSPLLVDRGDLIQDENATICCTCKIPWDGETIPYPHIEPPMGGGSTGPFIPPIW